MFKTIALTFLVAAAAGFAAGWYSHEHYYPTAEKRMERASEKMRDALKELTR